MIHISPVCLSTPNRSTKSCFAFNFKPSPSFTIICLTIFTTSVSMRGFKKKKKKKKKNEKREEREERTKEKGNNDT